MANEFTMTREEIMRDLLVIKADLMRGNDALDRKPGYGLGAGIEAVGRLIRLESEYQSAVKAAMEEFKARPDGPNVA